MTTATATRDPFARTASPQEKGAAAVGSARLPGWERCFEALVASLPFAELRWDQRRDRRRLSDAFRESWDRLTVAGTDELIRLTRGTYLAAADDRTNTKLVDVAKLADDHARRFLRDAPPLTDSPERLYVQVKGVDEALAYRAFARTLARRAWEVIARARFVLDRLQETGIAGRVAWGHRQCVFSYARPVLTDVEVDRKEERTEQSRSEQGTLFDKTIRTETVRSERTIKTATALHIFTHLVGYPETHPAPAKDVPKPGRITRHLEPNVPEYLLSVYITGELEQVSVEVEPLGAKTEQLIETTTRSRVERRVHWDTVATIGLVAGAAALAIVAMPLLAVGAAALTVTNDPALVVGNGQYVLTGWLPEEVPAVRRYRLQRT